jgi:IS30 family transposase
MRYRAGCQPQRCCWDNGRAQERLLRQRQGNPKNIRLVSSAIVKKLKLMAVRVKTLTFDFAEEFAGQAYVDEQHQSTNYFARPFASWERRSNENFNGLLRQYIPKKISMFTVTDEDI